MIPCWAANVSNAVKYDISTLGICMFTTVSESLPVGVDQLSVFLCHSSADKGPVRQLFERLFQIEKVQPWLDEECLIPGQD